MGTQSGTITCPDCGLVLREARDANSSTFTYDAGDWRRCCKRPNLDSPLWCLVHNHISSPLKPRKVARNL